MHYTLFDLIKYNVFGQIIKGSSLLFDAAITDNTVLNSISVTVDSVLDKFPSNPAPNFALRPMPEKHPLIHDG
jgi:hypothetical protein